MSLKESIKSKICIEPHLANFPFQSFIEWTSEYNEGRVLFCLNILQHELDAQKVKLEREKSELTIEACYWCFYCEQVRIYYRTLVMNPLAVDQLNFILF